MSTKQPDPEPKKSVSPKQDQAEASPDGRCEHDLCGCKESRTIVKGHHYCCLDCAGPEARQGSECHCGHGACRNARLRVESPAGAGVARDAPAPLLTPPIPGPLVL